MLQPVLVPQVVLDFTATLPAEYRSAISIYTSGADGLQYYIQPSLVEPQNTDLDDYDIDVLLLLK